jgi:hypothetical protein
MEIAPHSAAWRKEQATAIFYLYIARGSLMEVNISGPMRQQVEREFKKGLEGSENEILFEGPVNEILSEVLQGIWVNYVSSRRKRRSKKLIVNPFGGDNLTEISSRRVSKRSSKRSEV